MYRLKKEISFEGRHFWGFKGKLTLAPRSDGGDEWVWRAPSAGGPVVINSHLLQSEGNKLRLHEGGEVLNGYEDLGALRFFGLVGVEVRAEGWIPYFGCAIDIWNKIKASGLLVDEGFKRMALYTIPKVVRWTYPWQRSPKDKKNPEGDYTEIKPADCAVLTVDVSVNYPHLGVVGRGDYMFSFDNEILFEDHNRQLERVCEARSLGRPQILRRPMWLMKKWKGFPHYDATTWPQEYKTYSSNVLLQRILDRRVQDILATLSVWCGDGVFIGYITSHCSGHRADVQITSAVHSRDLTCFRKVPKEPK